MFLKLLGGIIVTISATLIGMILSWDIENRLKDLRAARLALQILEREISFLSNSLPRALISSSKVNGNVSKIFRECGEILSQKKGYSASEAWEMSINNNFKSTYLKKIDKDILINLGRNLGLYDMQNQTQSINNISYQLEIEEKNVNQLIVKNSKMYKNLAFLAGLTVTIILL